MPVDEPWAHSPTTASQGRPDSLIDHLQAVRDRAQLLAPCPTLGEVCGLLGLWHDLGKYADEFQRYIRQASADSDEDDAEPTTGARRVDHSTVGAALAESRNATQAEAILGRLMAYCIAGHHCGLADWSDGSDSGSSLRVRLKKEKAEFASARRLAPTELSTRSLPDLPAALSPKKWWKEASESGKEAQSTAAFSYAMACRMLFSVLVDADRLETERFRDPEQAGVRAGPVPTLADLAGALRMHMDGLPRSRESERVNAVRDRVLEKCRASAAGAPGIYSLTVPTGGGKTLSSLAFALEHGATHGLRRVIYAAPFTSIIEQNAQRIRGALASAGGPGCVLEHHSALDPSKETERSRLVTENWDAPVIVTTNVQLFESLMAASPSACRKLHNIARSVIILDEAQALPASLLRPCLAAVRCLVHDHGCTVVLCTATQPAVTHRERFPIGLRGVTEIMGDAAPGVFRALERVRVAPPVDMSDEATAAAICAEPRALCIVNTRGHAAALYALVKANDEEAIHLSASMCAAHRSDKIQEIERRLRAGETCRVVSTQVVEAGVDVDFPVVFRAMAGLDSIAQAAGRCNREGRLPGLGRVVVFRGDGKWRPPHSIMLAADDAAQVLPDHLDNPLGPDAITRYFEKSYDRERSRAGGAAWDRPGVMDRFRLVSPQSTLEAQFRTASREFRMIEDHQEPIIVPYGTMGGVLLSRVQRALERRDRNAFRQFQRLTVSVPSRVRDAMERGGAVTVVDGSFWVLTNKAAYDDEVGVKAEVVGIPPESLLL
ncbi:MAG TPA: CRISPR-associated helicase/endonuclease Cas3 [Phycisphaerales bacterium]|nr:CRISPR-associated helicase/endonuclease Cas3 [Phycisphaerales bacterium]